MSGYIFGAKHREYMRGAYRSTISIAEGAVRAGKTVDNLFVFAALLEDSPDRVHLATGATLGSAKLILGDCGGMGLERMFEGRFRFTRYLGNEAMEVATRTGVKIIIFAGGRNADSYKKIRGCSFGMWIATEINLHADSFIREAFNRQLAARDRRIFWDLNPCSPGSFIYTDYIDRFVSEGANYGHFTIFDNPAVSAERIAEIEAQYEKGSVWYRRDILGERCAAEGLIYRTFADNPAAFITEGAERGRIDFITIGADFGGNRSRTVFVASAICDDGITVIAEHAVSGAKGDIDPGRINREAREFLIDVRREYPGVYVKYLFADCAEQYLITGMRRYFAECGENITVCDCAKKPINDRISFVLSLMSQGRFRIASSCRILAEGLKSAVWDGTKEGDSRLDNFTSDIDVLDAMEYSIERYMKRIWTETGQRTEEMRKNDRY